MLDFLKKKEEPKLVNVKKDNYRDIVGTLVVNSRGLKLGYVKDCYLQGNKVVEWIVELRSEGAVESSGEINVKHSEVISIGQFMMIKR